MGGPSPVVFAYSDLASPDADLTEQLEEAFGLGGLGICTVSGVPGFAELRAALLPLAARFAGLPAAVRARYEDPASRYNFGWSCGVEVLEGGQPDTRKGSFCANPLVDAPAGDDDSLARRFPALARPNLWPAAELPELEGAFKALGALIVRVGLLLMRHADKYVAARAGMPPRLHDILQQSSCPKGRLLHYFAAPESENLGAAAAGANGAEPPPNWCGWHCDNGSLTGLCSAMYLDAAGQPAACPDPQAGLHIKGRAGNVVQVSIPESHIGFQVGEALQIHSGGLLRGTPHAVFAPRPELSGGISRNTFAVFMQPGWDCPLDTPAGVKPEAVGIGHWAPGLTFGEVSEATMSGYYKQPGGTA